MHISSVQIHHDRFPVCDSYPFNLKILQQTEQIELTSPVTLFTGENGTGKSTFLSAICRRCGIHIWEGVELARVETSRHERNLHTAISVEWVDDIVPGSYFGSNTFNHFARVLDQWAATDPGQLDYFGGKSLLSQSHGQSLLAYFRSRYEKRGLYFLDEPETALSPASQIELLRLLREMAGRGHAQFLIATHSPILLACPGATIYSFDHIPLSPVNYEQIPHVTTYRDFLNDPGRFLNDI